MKQTTNTASREQRLQALRVAEAIERFKAEDENDMKTCVEDLVKVAQLDKDVATKIALAYRNQEVTNHFKEAGLSDEQIAEIMGGSERPANFANVLEMKKKDDLKDKSPEEETLEDEIEEHGHIPTTEEEEAEGEEPEDHSPEVEEAIEEADDFAADMDNDAPKDLSEDNETTVIQLEIPTSQLNVVQKAIEKAVENVLGEGIVTEEDSMLDMPDAAEDALDKANFDIKEEDKMKPEALAARKQARAAILANVARKVVAEELPKPKNIGLGSDTSHGGKAFQHNETAQYEYEDDLETMTLERSEGNSLRGQNPTFNKQVIPTNNPENLGLSKSLEVGKKEGTPDGSLEYKVDFQKLNNIPSGASRLDGAQEFAVPTQMPETAKRTRNVSNVTAAKIVECQGCDNPRKAEVFEVECQDCNHRIAICADCEADEYCPSCASIALTKKANNVDPATVDQFQNQVKQTEQDQAMIDEVKQSKKIVDNGDGGFARKPHKDDTSDRKAQLLFETRVAHAYDLGYQLLMNGAFESADAAREQIGLWLTSEVDPRYMETQARLLMASATNRIDRVAAQAANMSRQASSNVGMSTTPALMSSKERTAPQDLQEALKTLWSSEQYEN